MAWKKVKVIVGKEKIDAVFDGSNLDMPNIIDVGDSINIDNKEYDVVSSVVDYRDDILKINLAGASKPIKKEKKSDDKQTKG